MTEERKYWPEDHIDIQVIKSELLTLKRDYGQLKKEHDELKKQMNNRIWAFFVFAGSGVVSLLVYIFSPILGKH